MLQTLSLSLHASFVPFLQKHDEKFVRELWGLTKEQFKKPRSVRDILKLPMASAENFAKFLLGILWQRDLRLLSTFYAITAVL